MATRSSRDRDREEPKGRKRGGGEDLDFTPVDYDVSEMPVDAPEGAYDAKIKKVSLRKTKEDGYPMLEMEFRLTGAHDEDGEDAVKAGASLTSFIAFFPKSEGRRGAPSKIALKALVDNLKLDEDLVPKRIESKRDLEDLMDALKGQELTVWVVHREDKNSGEVRCDVRFKAPKTGSTSSRKDRDDEDDDRRSSRSNGKAANGNGKAHARDRDEDADEDEDKPRARARGRDEDDEDEDRPRVNARGGSDRRERDDEDEDRPRARNRRDRDEDEDRPRARSRD